MDDKKTLEVADLHLEESHNMAKSGAIEADELHEHQLTVAHCLKHHKTLVWWIFYWAMCAVGWSVHSSTSWFQQPLD